MWPPFSCFIFNVSPSPSLAQLSSIISQIHPFLSVPTVQPTVHALTVSTWVLKTDYECFQVLLWSFLSKSQLSSCCPPFPGVETLMALYCLQDGTWLSILGYKFLQNLTPISVATPYWLFSDVTWPSPGCPTILESSPALSSDLDRCLDF